MADQTEFTPERIAELAQNWQRNPCRGSDGTVNIPAHLLDSFFFMIERQAAAIARLEQDQETAQLKARVLDKWEGYVKARNEVIEERDASRARVAELEVVLNVMRLAITEIDHARNNPGWFTHGESAAWQQTSLWIERTRVSLAEAAAGQLRANSGRETEQVSVLNVSESESQADETKG